MAGPRDALLAEVRDVSRQWLIARLRVTLARLDDRLFEQAVNSISAAEQNAWFDAMRALRGGGDGLVRSLADDWVRRMEAFFAVVSAATDADHSAAIRAAHEAQPKALRGMITRAGELHRAVLDALHGLMNGLAGRHCVEAQAFALLWPAELCASCDAVVRRLLGDATALPVVFDAFDEGVLQELDELCTHLAGIMVDAGITPFVVDDCAGVSDASIDELSTPVLRDLGGIATCEDARERCIDLLEEQLLADDLVAPAVRAEVARLIPVLRAVARRDAGLLGDGAHPLARLLNSIAHATMGWQARDAGGDLVLERLGAIVDLLRTADTPDMDLLQRALADWQSFAVAETRRAQLMQRRVEESEQAALLSATAHAAVDELLGVHAARRVMPSAAMELLREGWRRVLVTAWLRGGMDGQEWQLAVDDMQAFIALWLREAYAIPDALEQRLRDRMLHAGVDPLRIEILLSGITEAFASWDAPSDARGDDTHRAPPLFTPRALPVPDAAAATPACNVVPGTWFRFEGHGGSPVYGRFATTVGTQDALLFVDREGRKLACYTPTQFNVQVQLRRITAVPHRLWFDAALDAVLASVRGKQHYAA